MKSVTIDIPGHCPCQGSMKHIGRGRLIHQNVKAINKFRKDIKEATMIYHDEFYIDDKDVGYVVELITYIDRPKSVTRPFPTVKGSDLDKVCRAVLDSLSYDEKKNKVGLYKDDSQVIDLKAKKRYINDKNPEEHTIIILTKISVDDDKA